MTSDRDLAAVEKAAVEGSVEEWFDGRSVDEASRIMSGLEADVAK